ncbi:tRNA pseudouridine(55) synthase TruB [Leptolyngbya sp. AN02str]|uniref:tRNA pseudouridine(55) synthase TruB n=1 Tax=Leptolyngbya sp. AN02str TaxID=3423363 RepID=UPI003D322005
MDGFLNLNKPAGLTSHDCVARVRRSLKMKRVGHAGTLDPAATGVLPMAVGRATRLLQFLPSDKAYRAVVRFGVQTTTDDLEGDVLLQAPAPWLTLEAVQTVLSQFEGTIQQIPPRYSAIQVGGKRLYDLARAGEAVDVPVRTVVVHGIEVLGWQRGDFPELEVAIACGSGTYIRSIARDLGDQLKTGATLASLLRTHSSGFDLDHSLSLDDLQTQAADAIAQSSTSPSFLTQPALALAHLPSISLADSETQAWLQGKRLSLPTPPMFMDEQPLCIIGPNDTFLGIGRYSTDTHLLIPWVVWN